MKDILLVFSVFLFVFRILKFIEESFFLKKTLTKFGTFLLLAFVFFLFVFKGNALWASVLEVCLSLLLLVTVIVFHRLKEKGFYRSFLFFLDRIILSMSCGQSLYESLQKSADFEKNTLFQRELEKIVQLVVFSQQNVVFLGGWRLKKSVIELQKVSQFPHHQRENLIELRKNLKIEEKIRRKSEQVLQQIRLQSLILSVLYVFIFSGVILFRGWKENSSFLLGSSFLFLMGLVWIHRGGRSYKWKV